MAKSTVINILAFSLAAIVVCFALFA